MASYRVLIKRSAADELESIPSKKARQRIVSRIRALSGEPRPAGCEKLAGHRNRYRIRQGPYRVVHAVTDARAAVEVVKVGHRRDVYR